MAFLYVITGLLLSTAALHAQTDFEQWKAQQQKEFGNYSEQQTKAFNDYRNKVNAEFANYLRAEWESFRASQGIPVPAKPKPVVPPTVDPNRVPSADPLPLGKVKPLPTAPVVKPQPVVPILPTPHPTPSKPQFAFAFYGAECKVSLEASHRFSLRDASENSVADAWVVLSDSRYNDLLNDCLALRDELNLCDWGYIDMLKTLSERFFGKPCNEAVLLQMFILTQSGYKVRMAEANGRLLLLVPFHQQIYARSYIPLNGINYVILDKSAQGQRFRLLNHEFPKEQQASLKMTQPNFPLATTSAKTFKSKRYPDLSVRIAPNKNLLDFYTSYPTVKWDIYAQASLSEAVRADLYPVLKQKIAGKSEKDAANMLIDFVQTAFDYKTDGEQFGYERSLFADETFFYPYSDCEDRSILYATLVRELLHLNVVLLNYPNHIATAVQFKENIQGDYLTIEGKKFIVCDPTFIGADIGNAMPQFKNVAAEVIKLN